MHKRYQEAWDALVEALDDLDVDKRDYAASLAEIQADIDTRLDAVNEEIEE